MQGHARHLAPSFRVLLAALALVTLAPSTGGFAQRAAFELRNGVVVDRDAGLVYVMSAAGGIDAVSLERGTVSWHSDDAARPLAAANGRVLAQAESQRPETLDLVMLDNSGRATSRTSVQLPAGVAARVDDGLTGTFQLRATPSGAGFALSWRSTRFAPRGALILDDASRPQIDTGGFSFDPATAAVTLLSGPVDGPQPDQVEVPVAQRLSSAAGSQFFSSSRDHILASEALPEPGVGGPSHRWTLFDRNGNRLGQIDAPTAYAPFFVTDALVLFETQARAWRDGDDVESEPLTLRAISLANGLEQWSVKLRDTEYRGPFPP